MSSRLQYLIDYLRNTPEIKARPDLVAHLSGISKYADSDEERAYLLGLFFKKKFDSDELPGEVKTALIDSIKYERLEKFYYVKLHPEDNSLSTLAMVLLIVGILAVAIGIVQLVQGSFSVGVSRRYLTFVIHDGGYTIIFGLIFFISGYARYRYEKKKKAFVQQLSL